MRLSYVSQQWLHLRLLLSAFYQHQGQPQKGKDHDADYDHVDQGVCGHYEDFYAPA